MAKGSRPPRETAFSWGQWRAIEEAIKAMKDRALTHLRHELTGKALFDAFVKDEHKDALIEVFKICEINVQHQSFQYMYNARQVEIPHLSADIRATFTIALSNDAKFKFLFPKYMAKGKLHTASPELDNMFRLLVSINFEWARAYQVLNALNNICRTPAQMKTVCPHLAPILCEHEATKDLGSRMMDMGDTKTLPAIPLELRKHALYIGETVAKGLLVPKTSELPEDDFTVTMKAGSTDKKRWNDNLVWGVMI